MRRFLFIAISVALFASTAFSSAKSQVLENAFFQDNAIYVYRNDGEFNAFLREDITKICLSRIDADSIEHMEFVIQEFHTPDSIFRIPLHAIDSVSLVQPKIILSPKVLVLTKDYLPYVKEITSWEICFSNDTPPHMLPSKGDVLVSEIYEGVLENGFAGVIDYEIGFSEGKLFRYRDATIDDIYDQLLFTTKSVTHSSDNEIWESSEQDSENYTEQYSDQVSEQYSDQVSEQYSDQVSEHNGFKSISRAQTYATGKLKTHIPTIKASAGFASIEARPTVTLWATINKNPNIKTKVQMIMAIESDVTAKIEATTEGAFEVGDWLGDRISIPTPVPGLRAFLKAGLFLDSNCSITASLTSQGHFYRKFGIVVDDQVRIIDMSSSSIQKPEMELVILGEVKAGICLRAGMEFIHEKLASAYLTFYAGMYAESELSFKEDESPGLKFAFNDDSSMEIGAYLSGEPGFTILTEDIRFDKEEGSWLGASEKKFVFRKFHVLPEFSELRTRTTDGSIIAQCTPGRELFWPVKLGIGIRKYDWYEDQTIQYKWIDQEYLKQSDWSEGALTAQFSGLRAMDVYTAFPVVDLFGVVFADTNDNPITVPAQVITGEAKEITSSSATLYGSTPSNVDFDHWQCQGFYVSPYPDCDPDSEHTMMFTTDQTGPEFSATVTGLDPETKYYYQAFIGNNDQFFGKIRSFTTEEGEEEAPCEAVDLGLSVLWGSANLGTSDCLEPGDFYAWGETWTKYEYTQDNCTSINENLGNIKGSAYDPVHRKYHGRWRMPTRQEFEELLTHCAIEAERIEYLESVWDEEKGCMIITQTQKDVVMAKSPNGNAIVLAYTGAYEGDDKICEDQIFYWTATPEINAENDKAYSLWIDYMARHISIDSTSRHFGLPIRPVRERD